MTWTRERVNEVYAQVHSQAQIDKEFRDDLLRNPREAVEKLIDESLPEGYSINVIENDPAYSATLALPSFLGGSLSDEELAEVAGGACPSFEKFCK